MNLAQLPILKHEILLGMNPFDLAELCKTNKEISKICQSEDFWKSKYQQDFGTFGKTYLQQYQCKLHPDDIPLDRVMKRIREKSLETSDPQKYSLRFSEYFQDYDPKYAEYSARNLNTYTNDDWESMNLNFDPAESLDPTKEFITTGRNIYDALLNFEAMFTNYYIWGGGPVSILRTILYLAFRDVCIPLSIDKVVHDIIDFVSGETWDYIKVQRIV